MTVIVEKQLSTSTTFQTLAARVAALEAAGGGTVSDWGDIGGTLSDQTDLQTALNAKASTSTVTTNDSAAVHKTGNETVAGIKTFSASPIVPTPSTDFQAATKKYVDDNGGATTNNYTATITGGNM